MIEFLYSFCIFLWPSFTVSVWRASKLSVLKIDKNCNSTCLGIFRNRMTIFRKTLGGLGSLMYEGFIPEMRIWSIY